MMTNRDTALLVIDFQIRLMPVIHENDELEHNVCAFIKGCRLLNLPILTTQQYTKGLGETIPGVKEAIGESEYIEKISFSCCGCKSFIEKLESAEKKNIIVIGIEAHICVQQTVLDLLSKGYNVYVIADCIGSRKESDKYYAEKRMRQAGAVITTMEAALFELLMSADHPARKEVANLIK